MFRNPIQKSVLRLPGPCAVRPKQTAPGSPTPQQGNRCTRVIIAEPERAPQFPGRQV
jgi:hypothetical protein